MWKGWELVKFKGHSPIPMILRRKFMSSVINTWGHLVNNNWHHKYLLSIFECDIRTGLQNLHSPINCYVSCNLTWWYLLFGSSTRLLAEKSTLLLFIAANYCFAMNKMKICNNSLIKIRNNRLSWIISTSQYELGLYLTLQWHIVGWSAMWRVRRTMHVVITLICHGLLRHWMRLPLKILN